MAYPLARQRSAGRAVTRRGAIAGAVAAFVLVPSLSAQEFVPLSETDYALGDQFLGAADAPVTIVEYASLTCPHCARFHEEILPQIKARYIDTGKAKLIFREVYFDRLSLWSSMLARCGGEEAYFGFIEAFLQAQNSWIKSGGEAIQAIRRIGKLGGLSDAQMDACFKREDLARMMVETYQKSARADGVESTPTLFVNGKRMKSAFDMDAIAKALENAL